MKHCASAVMIGQKDGFLSQQQVQSIIYVYDVWCRNNHIREFNSQNVILLLLIHAYNDSATQNIAISTEGAYIILNNNCSLPLVSDCCHQNGKTTSGNIYDQSISVQSPTTTLDANSLFYGTW